MKNIRTKPPSKKKRRYITAGIVILAALILVFFEDHGAIKRFKLEKEKADFRRKIESEREVNDSLLRQIEKLIYDSSEIERCARIMYGMAKPGEKIYYIKP